MESVSAELSVLTTGIVPPNVCLTIPQLQTKHAEGAWTKSLIRKQA